MIAHSLTFIFVSLLFLTACGQVADQPVAVELDDKALSLAEKLYCDEGQHLVEDRTALNVTFDKLRAKSNIFAFAKGSGPCALQNDIDYHWPSEEDPMFFKLKLNEKCLPNKSVWTATALSLSTEQKYSFRRVGKPSWPSVEMSGSKQLAGSYVAGVTGLIVLVCQ